MSDDLPKKKSDAARKAELIKQIQLQEALKFKRAQAYLLDFATYVNPRYEINWHHIVIADHINRWVNGDISKLLINVGPQMGKMLSINELCLTVNGFVEHGSLRVGDYVFNHKGEPVKVLAVTDHYEWDIAELRFQDGSHINCAPEHEWVIYQDTKQNQTQKTIDGVKDQRYKESYNFTRHGSDFTLNRRKVHCEAQEILELKNRRAPSVVINEPIQLPEKDLPIDPYIMGVFLADGSRSNGYFSGSKQKIGIWLDQIDMEAKIKKDPRKNDCYDFILPLALRQKLICDKKVIPQPYLLASIEQRKRLLQGWLDGDGHIDENNNVEVAFGGDNLSMVEDFAFLVRSLGYKPSVRPSNAKCQSGEFKRVRIRWAAGRELISNRSQINEEHEFRFDAYQHFISCYTPLGKTIGNCIQVEGGIYLAGKNLIPTHNSELSCRLTPAFILGLNPYANIAICSYTADLANSFNRDCQRYMDSDEYLQLFPDSMLPNLKEINTIRTQHEFRLPQGGGLMSVGIGGPLTGKNLTHAILDDVVKNYEESISATVSQKNLDWYNSVVMTRFTRVDPKILMLMTRWGQMDLAERVCFEQEEGEWEVLKIPSISTDQYLEQDKIPGDPRIMQGESAWSEWHSIDKLLKIREASGTMIFNALYQQDPFPQDGLIFKRDDFQIMEWGTFALPPVQWDFFIDPAYTAKAINDPSALLCCGYDAGANIMYIRDVQVVRMELPELVKMIIQWSRDNGYSNQSRIYVENQASGKSVVQAVRAETNLNVKNFRWPKVDGVTLSDKDKVVRAHASTGKIESGRVKLIKGKWNQKFLDELSVFPQGRHDDQVDCLTMAVIHYFFRKKLRGIKIH